MDHVRIIRDIEMKKYAPIYFLMGEEPYFIDLITQAVEEKILDESEKAFGETIVYGRDVTMEQILMLAKGFPMMGNYQTVIVKEAQDMKEWKKQTISNRLKITSPRQLQAPFLFFASSTKHSTSA